MGAAVKLAVAHLHPVTDDHTAAVNALGRKGVDRAFEAIEHMSLLAHHYRKRLVIFISTDFTLGHFYSFLL
jgi:hypothetical protein